MKLQTNEYNSYFETYVSKALHLNQELIETMQSSLELFFTILSDLPEEKHLYTYGEGKWTIKELISHMIDTERIMAYRALRISRNDKADLLGFNENDFVANSNANEIPYIELLTEFSLVRKASIAMFKSFNKELLERKGKSSGSPISTRAIGYIISGHVLHHLEIIKDRYLN